MCAAGIAHAQDDVQPRMQLWSKALGVECTHCHTDGNWPDASKPTFDFAQRMKRMMDGLNAGPLKSVGSVTCWTCHRGRAIPARLPRESWQKIQAEHQAEFDGNTNRGLAMSVYAASLGVTCSHCHEDQDRAANTKQPKAMVAAMEKIFEDIPTYFAARQPVTQCYMCHQGHISPAK